MTTPGAVRFEPSALCPLEGPGHGCGRSPWTIEATARGAAPEWDSQVFDIQLCTRCNIRFTDPIPTDETLPELYGGRTSRDFQADDPPVVAVLKAAAARREIRRIARRAGTGSTASVLDYGCGNGAHAVALCEVLRDASVLAADWHDGPPWALRGSQLGLSYAPYEQLRSTGGAFDLIYCRHVIEHSRHPVALLEELAGMLAPGGRLVVEVPSADTPLRKLFGASWEAYYAPFHTVHLGRAALTSVLERAGLRVARLEQTDIPFMGRSLRNVVGRPYSAPLFAAGVVLHPLQVAVGLLTGRGTGLRAYAAAA